MNQTIGGGFPSAIFFVVVKLIKEFDECQFYLIAVPCCWWSCFGTPFYYFFFQYFPPTLKNLDYMMLHIMCSAVFIYVFICDLFICM